MNVATLRRQNAALREENLTLQAEKVRLEAQLREREAELREREAEIVELKRQLFGPRADRLTPEQEAQLVEVAQDLVEDREQPVALSAEVLAAPAPPRRPRRVRHPLPVHLEVQTTVLEPPAKPVCPRCGQVRCIGEEVTEEIDVIPARLIRRRIVRRKYACRCGDSGVTIAPLPPRLVPQSRLGLGLAVHLLLARFDDHLSYYTLERQLRERHGVVIPRQQMVQWVEAIALLLVGLVELMFQQMKAGGYLQVDETPVKVLDPEVQGKAAQGYLWFYAVPGGDVFLDFQTSRGQQPPRQRLADFTGTIQTDAYQTYQAVVRQTEGLRRIGCAAHCRRTFRRAVQAGDLRAIRFIAPFRLLYRIEDQARGWAADQRHAWRQQQGALALWEAMKQKAQALQPALLPQSPLGKAVGYLLNEYPALTAYLESGRWEIDNNLVENSIRPVAVGRKRWLFIGDPEAGWRSAVLFSLMISCRRRGLNPQEYFTDILARLPGMKASQVAALLPGQWKPAVADTS
jgi:transposase